MPRPRRTVRTEPPTLPAPLLRAAPVAKLVWAWLLPQGVVPYSTRELAEALGLSQPATTRALNVLRHTTPPLLEDMGTVRERVRPRYRVLECEGPNADKASTP